MDRNGRSEGTMGRMASAGKGVRSGYQPGFRSPGDLLKR